MKVKLRYVQQRGNALFFRISIPAALRNHYDGRKEITQTLRTDDHIEAQDYATQLAKIYKKQFRELHSGRQISRSKSSEDLLDALQLDSPVIPVIPVIPVSKPVELAKPVPSGLTLTQVYKEVKALGKRSLKEENERWASTRLLLQWCGDLPVTQYNRTVLLDFRDTVLRNLPLQVFQRSCFRGKTLKQILEMKTDKVISTTTVNNHLSRIRSVFNYAVRHGYMQTCPTVDLELTPDDTNFSNAECEPIIIGIFAGKHVGDHGDAECEHMGAHMPAISQQGHGSEKFSTNDFQGHDSQGKEYDSFGRRFSAGV